MAKKKISEAEIKQMISELSRPQSETVTKEDSVVKSELPVSEAIATSGQNKIDITQPLEPQLNKKLHIKRLWWQLIIAVLLTLPLLMLTKLAGFEFSTSLTLLPHQTAMILILSTLILFFAGGPFFIGAWHEIRQRRLANMTLVLLAALILYAYSIDAVGQNYLATTNIQPNFFWQLAVMLDVALLGRVLELKLLTKKILPITMPTKTQVKVAHKIDADGQLTDINVNEVIINDELVINPDELIPVDGVIIAGETTVNEAVLTGESTPVSKKIGSEVLSGCINGAQPIRIKVTKSERESFLAQVEQLIVDVQTKQGEFEIQANRVASSTFYLTLFIALGALITWAMLRGLNDAVLITATVLVIVSPHALNLVVPLLTARFSQLAAHNGLIVRNLTTLEKANDIKYALMDKTGTLTEGKFKIRSLKSISSEYSDSDVLAIMATLEQDSNHPLAQGIKTLAQDKQIDLMQSSEVETIAGIGMVGVLNNQRFALVSSNYLEEHKIDFDREYFDKLADAGNSVSFLVTLGRVVGIVAQGDDVKPTGVKFVRALKQQGITPVMLTGDNPHIARKIAKNLEIDEFKAHLKPEDKVNVVKAYQAKGAVMMVGDGINDSLALKQADLAVALGVGTKLKLKAADAIVIKPNPIEILKLLKLAKQVNTKFKQSLWLLAIYNGFALALAAGILISFGFGINLIVATVIGILATMVIVINGVRLEIK